MIKADERREEIANYVIKLGQVRIDELVEHFGVSRMTIHRHIDRLAHQGVLRKLHGAVTVQPSGIYESTFRYRMTVGRADTSPVEPSPVSSRTTNASTGRAMFFRFNIPSGSNARSSRSCT